MTVRVFCIIYVHLCTWSFTQKRWWIEYAFSAFVYLSLFIMVSWLLLLFALSFYCFLHYESNNFTIIDMQIETSPKFDIKKAIKSSIGDCRDSGTSSLRSLCSPPFGSKWKTRQNSCQIHTAQDKMSKIRPWEGKSAPNISRIHWLRSFYSRALLSGCFLL